jgi:hypothetical protein
LIGLFGTAEQAAEKLAFSKSTKNGSRQNALGTIRKGELMVLHPPNFTLLQFVRSFSAASEAVPFQNRGQAEPFRRL